MTPPAVADLIDRLSSGAISLEQFLWGARDAGIDRREAARYAVSAAATATPGSRSVRGPDLAGGRPALGGAASDDVLRIGLWIAVDGLDPAVATYRSSRLATEQLYSTLMALGPDGRPYPDLAAWLEVSDDALTYTFGLVEGVRFHDGSALTADDVAFTFRRLLDMGEAYHFDPWVATIAGAEAVDPMTVRITLTQPTGPILTWLAFCGTGVVRRADVEAGRDLTHDPNGSGPFRLAAPWPGGDAPIRLARHDGSVRGAARFAPRLAGLEFHVLPAAAERAAALRDGRIDLDALMAPTAFAEVAATPGRVAHETPDSRWHWLVVNCGAPPLDDVRVRTAIALAIDREALLEGSYAGHGTPIGGGVVAPWSFAAAPELVRFGARPNLPAAQALLASAGVPSGTRLTIVGSDPVAIRQAELVAAQLAAIGLAVEPSAVDGSIYAGSVTRGGSFHLATSYWGSPIWDPDDFVYMGFRSGARYDAGGCSTPALDEAMDRGRGTVVQADRLAAYRRLQELAVDQLPVIPTIQPAMLRGTSARLAGYVPTPCAQLRTLRDAWLTD